MGLGKHALYQIDLLKEFRPDIKISYLVDNSIASYYRFLDKFNNKVNSKFSTSIIHSFKSSNPDLIYISTLADSHVEIAMDLIENGFHKDIIIEKPLSNSLEKANYLKNKIKEYKWNGDIYLGFYRRTNELLNKVRDITLSGNLGSLKKINLNKSVELSMNGSHWIDFANWIVPEKQVNISSELIWNHSPGRRGARILDPICNLNISYKNGTEFYITPTYDFNKDELIELEFTKGNILINDDEEIAKIKSENNNKDIYIPKSKDNSFLNFIHYIENENSNLPKIEEGLNVLETVFAAHISDQLNKKVPFPVDTKMTKFSLNVG